MTFKETLQAKLIEARKGKNSMQMGLLQLILGSASTQEARAEKPLTDEQLEAIVRKTAKGNYTSMAMVALGEGATDEQIDEAAKKISDGNQELLAVVRAKNPDALERMTNEDAFLMTLLPTTLTVEQIKTALIEVLDAIKEAKNEGAATGVAVKMIKSKNLKALGENVKKAVQELRA